jgi:hypothetical protein
VVLKSRQTELKLGSDARFVLADGRRATSGAVVVPDPAMMSAVVDRLVELAAVDEGLDVDYVGAEIEPSATVLEHCRNRNGVREDLEALPKVLAELALAAAHRSDEARPQVVVLHDAGEPFRIAPKAWSTLLDEAPAGGCAVIAVAGGMGPGHLRDGTLGRGWLLEGTCVYFVDHSQADVDAAFWLGLPSSHIRAYPRGTGLVFQKRRLVGTWTL